MSNTVQTNATLVAQETLKTLAVAFPALTQVAHRFDAGYKFNQTVKVPLISSTTAASYDTTNGYVPIDRTVSSKSVLIDQHAHHTFELNPQELASTNPAIINELASSGAFALGRSIMDAIVAKITIANYSNATTADTLNFSKVVAVDKALADRGAADPKFMVVNSTGFSDLLSDETIHSGLVNPGSNTVRTGVLNDVAGFGVSRYAGLTTPTGEKLKGFAGNRDAICLVAGLPEEPSDGNPVNITVVSDTNSGLSLMSREWVDARKGSYNRTVTLVYGLAVGSASMLQRIVTT